MRILYSIILIGLLSGVAYAQDNNMDPTDHEIATWQFRSISPSDVANFLSNEDNVFRKAVKSAIADGRMRHWGLLRKVNGNTSSGHNYFFYNGFDKITDFNRYNHLVGIKALYSKKFISACYHHQKQIYVQFYRIPGFHKTEARMTLAKIYSDRIEDERDDE